MSRDAERLGFGDRFRIFGVGIRFKVQLFYASIGDCPETAA